MIKIIFLSFLLLLAASSSHAGAKKVEVKNYPWAVALEKEQITAAYLCGNDRIQLTKKSIARDFIIGNPPIGFLFTDLISYDEYWNILKTRNLEDAKVALKDRFSRARLWKATENGIQNLGNPNKFNFAFTATVKDCVEGAKTTLGMNCSKFTDPVRCCSEKFVGPNISWSDKAQLLYSPDPSVRLRVFGESKHRYCQVVDALILPLAAPPPPVIQAK